MSCIQQNFPSKFEPNDAFYEKLEENTFVAFILRHPVGQFVTHFRVLGRITRFYNPDYVMAEKCH